MRGRQDFFGVRVNLKTGYNTEEPLTIESEFLGGRCSSAVFTATRVQLTRGEGVSPGNFSDTMLSGVPP